MQRLAKSDTFKLGVACVVVVGLAYNGDHAACSRSNDGKPLSNQRGQAQVAFYLKAAQARTATADKESANGDIALAAIDYETAADYKFIARSVLSSENFDCGLPWPSTHAPTGHPLPPLDVPSTPGKKE